MYAMKVLGLAVMLTVARAPYTLYAVLHGASSQP